MLAALDHAPQVGHLADLRTRVNSMQEQQLRSIEGAKACQISLIKQSLADGRVTKNDRVMLFNCATGLKYPLPPVTRTLDRHQPIDYAKL